jgi:hypothetical protein
VLEWKLQAFVAAQTQTYTVTWHNANPTAWPWAAALKHGAYARAGNV